MKIRDPELVAPNFNIQNICLNTECLNFNNKINDSWIPDQVRDDTTFLSLLKTLSILLLTLFLPVNSIKNRVQQVI